ncbi:uncharacterized protein UTRI_00572_B [Ustilago trichophora]|uniref:FHA domain-containing protein n=1 Tax=Ustilago trichophora TaxID=86804 RepID=A0A5C3DRH6_9BASI|nr:uncharacterized protein UTRI_00572_B [Ustilago trichophora]
MTPLSAIPGLELVWVNASPTGPIANDNKDPSLHQILRIQAGRVKTIARSSSPTRTVLVNDLSTHIYFPLAKVVSREHATIEWLHDEPIVRDRGATHGTHVAHRQALFATDGTVYEIQPSAPLQPVEGILPLRHGDLIEFGKTCSRSNESYNPVRCYVRFLSAAPPSSSASLVPTKPFSLIDDPLDSESDIVSIDADSFRASTSAPLGLQSTLDTLSSMQMQTDIVDLTSDDDEEPHSPPSDSSLESDGSELDGKDSDDSHFDSDLEESIDSFGHREVLWCREIEEASLERAELDSEAIEARMQGEGYLKSYKTRCGLTADSPNTSINSETSNLEISNPDPSPAINTSDTEQDFSGDISPTDDVKELANITRLASSPPPIAAPLADLADKPDQSSTTENPIIPASVAVDLPSVTDQDPAKKRKMDDVQEAEPAEDMSESDSGSEASSSSASESLTSSVSTSSSPSPPKKRRITHLHHGGDERRAPLRGRTIKKLVAKAMYATSLLSLGFLTGSLFTFKSMMNAAAAANAAGKQ